MKRTKMSLTLAFATGLLAALCAKAALAHEANLGNNLAQNYVSHPDVAIVGAAAPAVLLAGNSARVSAVCQNLGTTNVARVGDSSTGAAQGTAISPGGAATFDITGALYGFSQGGTSLNCAEIIRP
jgi:hypothetical protein